MHRAPQGHLVGARPRIAETPHMTLKKRSNQPKYQDENLSNFQTAIKVPVTSSVISRYKQHRQGEAISVQEGDTCLSLLH